MRFQPLGLLFCVVALSGCASRAASSAVQPATPPATGPAKILEFSLAPTHLKVDKVGTTDGSLKPDNAPDIVFSLHTEGPLDALFVVSCDAQGNPSGSFRANTLIGNQEAPEELGGTLELGRLSIGIGVEENGKFLNLSNGAIPALRDRHSLLLYTADTKVLREGFVRAYARQTDGTLVKGPVIRYGMSDIR